MTKANAGASRLGAFWRALVTGPAPVRLWAQVLGFGTIIAVLVHTLGLFFDTINRPDAAPEVVKILANGAVWIGMALCFIALAEVIAITELKLGLNASKTGFHADLERDDAKADPSPVEPPRDRAKPES